MFWKKVKELQTREEENTAMVNRLIARVNVLENTLNEYKGYTRDLYKTWSKELDKAKRIIKYGKSGECTYNMVSGYDHVYSLVFVSFKNTLYIYNDGEEYSIDIPELSKYNLKNDHIAEFIIKHDGIVYVTIIPDDNSMYSFVIDYKNDTHVCAKTEVPKEEGETK